MKNIAFNKPLHFSIVHRHESFFSALIQLLGLFCKFPNKRATA